MKSCLPAVLLLLLLPVGRAAEAAPDDPLWGKAVDLAANSRRWIAGEVRTRELELDRKGHVQSSRDYLSTIRLGPDGKLQTDHWRIENGQRVPHVEEEEEESTDPSTSFGPLDTENQPFVHIRRLPGAPLEDTRPCVDFEFELAPPHQPGLLRGTVRLADPTGMPIRMTLVPDPLPDDVQSLLMTLTFDSPDASSFRPASMTTDLTTSFFLLTKKIRFIQEFSSFWTSPESPPVLAVRR